MGARLSLRVSGCSLTHQPTRPSEVFLQVFLARAVRGCRKRRRWEPRRQPGPLLIRNGETLITERRRGCRDMFAQAETPTHKKKKAQRILKEDSRDPESRLRATSKVDLKLM